MLVMAVTIVMAGCNEPVAGVGEPTLTLTPQAIPSPTPEPVFSGALALEHVAAQVALGPRPTGSEASRQTGDYILSELAAAGWTTQEQPFTYQGVQARNLIGKAGPSGGRVLIIGAHYDTRRVADRDATRPTEPVLGANDGASGVAVLLELARVLNTSNVNAEVWLVFFDAEDNGNLDGWEWIVGSRYFVANLTLTPEFAFIVDMVGDADLNLYYERNSNPELTIALWDTAAALGYEDTFVADYRHSMLDDHTPFLEANIPAVDIIDFDYPYWHTTEDTLDKVSASSLERVGRVLEVYLEAGGQLPASQQ
jgi:hypothetical protein